MGWFGSLFGRKERERRLNAELRFHLEEQTRDNIAAGMSPEKARREALLEFGGVEQIKEECRDLSSAVWLEGLVQDVKFSFRSLGQSPGFTTVAIATIAIGIGFNAAIFSYLDGILFRPVDYPDAERLVWLSETGPGGRTGLVSTLNFLDWEQQNTVFEYMAPHRWGSVALTGSGIPAQVYCERVGAHFFDIFKVSPLMGRLFLAGDDQPGHDHVVIVNYAFWQSHFAGDPDLVGKSLMLDGEPYTVIGVLPKGITDSTPAKLWRPLAFSEKEKNRGERWLLAWGKLRKGVSLPEASAQLDTLAKRLAHDYPAENRGWSIKAESGLFDHVPIEVKQSLYLLMASVGMVMLIACANLANLTLARAAAREREVAVRAALGAGRWRLVRQFLTESLLLSCSGGLLGIGVAYGSLAGLNRLVPSYYIPINKYVEMDGRVLIFILVLAMLTGLTFGLYPALKGSRPDLRHSLSQGGTGSSGSRRHQRFRSALVILEVALAIVLLFGGGLLIRSFAKLKQVETGFDATNVVVAGLPIDGSRFSTAAELNTYLRKITDRLSALPGVRDVALTNAVPLQSTGYVFPFQLAGEKDGDRTRRPFCYFKTITPSYFRLLGMHLRRGRFLDEHDLSGTAPVAIINETMASRHFANTDPVGQRILLPQVPFRGAGPAAAMAWEIVGVVADEKLAGLAINFPMPGVYVTLEQSPQATQSLLVRTAADPSLVQRSIPLALLEINAAQPLQDVTTLEEIKASSIGKQRLDSLVLGIFAGVATLLSALGLYGVISYSVAQRTREIGIRGALGATAADILWLTFRRGLILTGVGLLIGIAGAVGVGRILSSMLFQVEKFDALTLGSIIGIQAIVALLACFLPARRALKVSPIVALRCE